MDDQRFIHLARRANVLAEAFPLPFQIALQAEIIQTGFTDGDDFGMIGQFGDLLGGRFDLIFIIRMNTDGCK